MQADTEADPGPMPVEAVREGLAYWRRELVRLNLSRDAIALSLFVGRGIMAILAMGFGFCLWLGTLPSDNITRAICAVSCVGILAHCVAVFRKFELPAWRYFAKRRGVMDRVGVFLAELERRGIKCE